MNPDNTPKEIRQEAEERFPDNHANAILGNNIRQLRSVWIQCATKYSAELKEKEEEIGKLIEALEESKGVLFSIREDLGKESLGKIFVEKQIQAIDKLLKPNSNG